MNIEAILEEIKKEIDQYIFNYLSNLKNIESSHEQLSEVEILNDMMQDYPRRMSKGLRGGLCILATEAFGGKRSDALESAAALELFQNWVLIHDDIEDGSDMRRGEKALHEKYGIPLALNAGDGLINRMWELLLSTRGKLGSEKTFQVLEEFIEMTNETVEGQHIDLMWVDKGRWDMTEEEYCRMCRSKTARYTGVAPLRLGSLIAGCPEKGRAMDEFGFNFGIAFQIHDDLLNLVGDEEVYGKEIAGDLLEGKRTLILIHLMNHCKKQERDRVIEILSHDRQEKSLEGVEDVLKMMKKCGSFEYAGEKARNLSEKAKKLFDQGMDGIPDSKAKKTLRELIDFAVLRKS
jgi:geranylgeranyl diphosphate synthase type II